MMWEYLLSQLLLNIVLEVLARLIWQVRLVLFVTLIELFVFFRSLLFWILCIYCIIIPYHICGWPGLCAHSVGFLSTWLTIKAFVCYCSCYNCCSFVCLFNEILVVNYWFYFLFIKSIPVPVSWMHVLFLVAVSAFQGLHCGFWSR